MGDLFAAAQSLDTWLLLFVNRTLANPLFDLAMPVLSQKWSGVLLLGGVLPLLLFRGGRRAWVLVAAGLLAVGLADLSGNWLKHLVGRIRPCHAVADLLVLTGCTRSFSMPSNHAVNIAAVAATVWLGWRSRPWTSAAWLLASGVMLSRIYLGAHYPSDVLVGALWGGGIGALLVWGTGRYFPRLLSRQPPPVSAPLPGPNSSPDHQTHSF